ncbi:hypothetical protein D0Z07_1889 [Hyphodiscus hymeniophilus]|uniref:Phosphoglycerate mutase-like protein n=1 Tax=Hyphodiscus hymeniophilus TaxID=353542 RepID=A0A9P6VMU6_9HELO|nr:hypothetical protein D0Z07_1889 [Hyphodiscus hymeniophilus]
MALLHLAALLGLSTTALAQSQTVWASVVYTFYGEKIPSLTSGPYNLTPLGANQMFDAGSFLRSRNIDPPENATQLTGPAPINGISQFSIDNSQMYVMSTDDEFIAGSATAFMQGFYPPRGVPILDEQDLLANGTYDAFPLDNYQYPNIGTVSELDFNYIWIAGNIGCTNWAISQAEELESTSYATQTAATTEFYQSLASTVFWEYDPSIVDYENAWILYEYALYQYNHNTSQPISSEDLSQLYNLASQQQFDLNSPNTFGTIPSIAGATLASAVLQQLQHNIASNGVADKLTLLFGSFEPFLAFFALSNLATGQSGEQFNTLPLHGSLMTFELFSNAPNSSSGNSSSSFPTEDELFVRFLFRNGTSSTTPLVEYSLFNRGLNEDDMSWSDFVTDMGAFSLDDVNEWCSACDAITLFCEAIDADVSNDTSSCASAGAKREMSPAVGGVIGATVTLAVLVLGALTAALCGFRLEFRRGLKGLDEGAVGGVGVLKRSGSGKGGGFKGAEKLASDTDLTLKGGAGASVIRHERVGSWELNDQKNGSALDKDVESGRIERVVSGADYGRRSEEMMDPFGDPVKPLDQV